MCCWKMCAEMGPAAKNCTFTTLDVCKASEVKFSVAKNSILQFHFTSKISPYLKEWNRTSQLLNFYNHSSTTTWQHFYNIHPNTGIIEYYHFFPYFISHRLSHDIHCTSATLLIANNRYELEQWWCLFYFLIHDGRYEINISHYSCSSVNINWQLDLINIPSMQEIFCYML